MHAHAHAPRMHDDRERTRVYAGRDSSTDYDDDTGQRSNVACALVLGIVFPLKDNANSIPVGP